MTCRKLIAAFALSLISSGAFAQAPQQPPQQQGTARISGVVTRSDGKPAANASIRWVRWEGGVGKQGAARTDAQGKFVLDKIMAGSYQITAQAEGFVTTDYGQTVAPQPARRIEIVDAQLFEDANITLLKTSAIEGQLLDEFGDPVPGVTVQLAQVQFAAGANRLMPAPGQAPQPSDDRGHYRAFGLAPGDYYVMALSGAFAVPETSAGFTPTFFPGTAIPSEAKAVHVVAGQDVLGVGFSLSPAAMRTVSGVTLDADGKPTTAMVVLAQTSKGDVRAIITARGQSAPDGSFTFRNVPEGTYVIQGFGRPIGTGSMAAAPFGFTTMTVSANTPVAQIAVRPGAVARGRIVFEGDASAVKAETVRISTAPVEFVSAPLFGSGPPPGSTHDDWTFDVQNQSGVRRLSVSIGAPGWAVKSITAGGVDITDQPVDFRKGDINDLEITLMRRQTSISGTVMDGEAPAASSTIVVFSEDAAKWGFPSRFIATVVGAPGAGTFKAAGLPPSGYLVVALPSVKAGDSQDPQFLEALRPFATRVDLHEGDTKTVTLKIIKR